MLLKRLICRFVMYALLPEHIIDNTEDTRHCAYAKSIGQWLLANHSRANAHFFLCGIRFRVRFRVSVRIRLKVF